MLFNTPGFVLLFLPAVLVGVRVFYARGGPVAAKVALLGASLGFYAWGAGSDVLLLLGSIAVNWMVVTRVAGRRRLLAAGVAFDLGLLAVFKYGGMVAATGLALPLGISFFTFQQIMALVDAYRGERFESALDYASFVAFFPHLIAGPLVRPKDILPQLRRFSPRVAIAPGLEIFLLGMAKKLVLADPLGTYADPGFAMAASGGRVTLVEAWVAVLAYSLQIYFDFSGYADMAIGLAAMMGIEFPINFDGPYRASDISDFWRRWNMTLSRFLRDYLYIPLGGNRRGAARRYANLMITMLLGGLWHGAAWRFALWGALHGVYLMVHHAWRACGLRMPRVAGWVVTMLAVVVAWVPFRASGMAASIAMLRGMAGMNGIALPEWVIRVAPVLSHVAVGVPVLMGLGDARALALPQGVLLLALAGGLALLPVTLHAMGPRARALALVASFGFTAQALLIAPFARPFLYFRF